MLPTLSHQLLTRDYNQLVVVSLLLRYQNSLALWDYYCQSLSKIYDDKSSTIFWSTINFANQLTV